MLLLLSPAKTLDCSPAKLSSFTQPVFLEQTRQLISVLRKLSQSQIQDLMRVSSKIATLNYKRFQEFQTPFSKENSRQALLAFKGDVYRPIAVEDFSEEDLQFSQERVRILSGLYGLLRPLDLIQPYRLEMGSKLKIAGAKSLYDFWAENLTSELDSQLQAYREKVVVNLASQEYFKSVRPTNLSAQVLSIGFKEKRENGYQTIGLMAKRARGMMTRFVVQNRISQVEDLKDFRESGYEYRSDLSSDTQWTFVREAESGPKT